MKHKLIMENWRQFINESMSFDQLNETYDDQIEEGLGTTLLTMAAFMFGGQQIDLDKSELEVANNMMNKIELQGDSYQGVDTDDIRTAFDEYMAAAQQADSDGDGVADRTVKIQDKVQGNQADIIVGQLLDWADGKGTQQDTQPEQSSSGADLNGDGTLSPLELQKWQSQQR